MKKKYREIALTGGLGNQLFQISAALAIFKQQNIRIDCMLGVPRLNSRNMPELESFRLNASIEWLNKPRKNFHKRVFGLGIRLAVENAKSKSYKLTFFLYKFVLILSRLIFDRLINFPIVISRGVGFDYRIPESLETGFLMGYFQTYRYLDDPWVKEIMMTLEPKVITEEYEALASQMNQTKNTIIHIRMGDYRNEAKIGMIDGDYYSRAIRNASAEFCDNIFWLFSDEPGQAIKLIEQDLHSKIRIVDENLSTSETFELMRNGDYYIISNSTFSWWAASLARRDSPLVISPSPWFRGQESPIELIPQTWKTLNR